MSATASGTAENSPVEGEELSIITSPNESAPEDSWAEGEVVKNYVSNGDYSDEDGATSADGETSPGNIINSVVNQVQPTEDTSDVNDYDEQYDREHASQLARPPSRLGSNSVFSPDSSDEEDAEASPVHGERRPSSILSEEELRGRYMTRIMEEKVDPSDRNNGDPTTTFEITSAQKAGKDNIPRKRSQLGLSAGRNDLLETEDLIVPDPNVSPAWKQGQLLRRSPGPLKEVSQEFLRALRAKTNEYYIAIRQERKEPKDPLYADQHELHDMLNGWVDEVARLRENTAALPKLEQDNSLLTEELDRLQSSITAWIDAHAAVTDQFEHSQAHLARTETALAHLNGVHFELTRESEDADNQITELQIANDELCANITDLESKLQKAYNDLQNYHPETQSQARSEPQINPACENCPKLQQEIARLQDELVHLRAAIAAQPSNNNNANPEFQKRSEELAEEVEQLQQALARERGITAELKQQQTFALALSSSRQGEKWPSEKKRAIAETIVRCMRQAHQSNPDTDIEEIIALLDENLDIEQIAEWLNRRRYQFKPRTLFREVLFSGDAFNLGLVAAYLSIRGFLQDREVSVSPVEYIELHEALRQEWNEKYRHVNNELEDAEFKSNSARAKVEELEEYVSNLEELGEAKELLRSNPNLARELAESKRMIREQMADIRDLTQNAAEDSEDMRKKNWDLQTLRAQKEKLEERLEEIEDRGSSDHTLTQVKASEELAKRNWQLQQSNQQLQAAAQEVVTLRLKIKTLESSTVKGSQDGKIDRGDAALKEEELKVLRDEVKYATDRAQKKFELSEKYKRDIRDLQKRLQDLEEEHSKCGPTNGPLGEAEQNGLVQVLKLQLSEYKVELAKLRSPGVTADGTDRTAELVRLDECLKVAMVNIADLKRQLVERENQVKVAMARIAHSAAGSNERHSRLAENYRLAMASIAELNLQRQDISNENGRLAQERRASSVEFDRVVASLTADVARLEAEKEESLAGTVNIAPQGNLHATEIETLRTQLTAAKSHEQELASLVESLTGVNDELNQKLNAARHDEVQDRESLNKQLSVLDRENNTLRNAQGTLNSRLAFFDRDNRELRNILENTETRSRAQIQGRQLELRQANERLAELERDNARLVVEIASQKQTGDVSGSDNGALRTAPGTGLTGRALPIPHYIIIRPAQNTVNLDGALRQWDGTCNVRQTESNANNPVAAIAAYLREHLAVEPSISRSNFWSHMGNRRAGFGGVA